MSAVVVADSRSGERSRTLARDVRAACVVALVALVVLAAGGVDPLNQNGDNDSLLRLVQIRDLLAGQGWFDPTQYRMGPEGGFQMHWSRIVDAPVAVITLAAAMITGSAAAGEFIALVLWPALLYPIAVFVTIRAARAFAGDVAAVPAAVLAGVTYCASGSFGPGTLDHHNLQLVLTLTLVLLLLSPPTSAKPAAGAGAIAAVMLAIGMETLPYVMIGGLSAATLFLLQGPRRARWAAAFGLAFGMAALGCFALTIHWRMWPVAQCDAFSIVQLSAAVVAGFGLAAVAGIPRLGETLPRRFFSLLVLGASAAALVSVAFPQCLGDPLASLDWRLRIYWLDTVVEAQTVAALLVDAPARFAGNYITPLLAIAVLILRFYRHGPQGREAIVFAFLLGATMVSFWQVRGAMFSVPLAIIPLSAWIGGLRASMAATPPLMSQAGLVLAWLLSLAIVWRAAFEVPGVLMGAEAEAAVGAGKCYRAQDYETLAALPPATVLAVSNLGSSILAYTPHRALAGSYHRNVEGNLMTLDILMGPTPQARELLRKADIDLVAFCPGNPESKNLAEWAPTGFEAALRRGEIPEWLSPVEDSAAGSLRIFRRTR